MRILTYEASARLSVPGQARKTAGKFSEFVTDNAPVFHTYFGVNLVPGSFNIDVLNTPTIHKDLDQGAIKPCFSIPKAELGGKWMPSHLGNGQAWQCQLSGNTIPLGHKCWIFRRIGSQVPQGVLEILSDVRLVEMYRISDGDPLTLSILEGIE